MSYSMGNYIHYISPFFHYTIIYMYTVTHTSIKACYFFKEGNPTKPAMQPLQQHNCEIFTVRNEVVKFMFLQVSVCPKGGMVVLQHALQVVSQHALQQVSRGHALQEVSRGVPASGGSAPGDACWGVCSQGVCRPPQSRRLLLRTVRILLQCILVF